MVLFYGLFWSFKGFFWRYDMKRKMTALCIALATLSGCSDTEVNAPEISSQNDYSTFSQALIGEIGGLPWGEQTTAGTTSPSAIFSPSSPSGDHFGQTLVTGDFDNDGKIDFATSQGALAQPGKVSIKVARSANFISPIPFEGDDNFGASLAVTKCSNVSYGDVLIASSPTYSEKALFSGAFSFIYNAQNNRIAIRKSIYNTTAYELAGTVIAIGDINGDGSPDLIYQSSPLDENTMDYDKPKISVLFSICSYKDKATFSPSTSITAAGLTNFGSAIYIVDLDQTGNKSDVAEILVVDNLYNDGGEFVNGAIYFYKYDKTSRTLKQSRSPIIGDKNDKSGAAIESVAFSDIDGDGDLDLIVGEPMFNTNKKWEGRARTYTNPGPGKDFDPSVMAWSASADRTNARFGSSVAVADVNKDGVDDLIVGAPGYYESSQGYVYVYMGTKDGSVFSKDAFWTYQSALALNKNDAFGHNVAAINYNNKGWLDLIVTAPGSKSLPQPNGNLYVFNESNNFCYTADKCLIGNTCYEASAVSEDSKCKVCNPLKNNFDFVELTCEGEGTACQDAPTCDELLGCTMKNKEDGTSCAENTCVNNTLTVNTCKAGSCTPDFAECGNYVCDTSLNMCPNTCTSDDQCVEPYVCENGKCQEIINLPPTLKMPVPVDIAIGRSATLTATATDPEGDELSYQWSCNGSGILYSNANTNSLFLSISSNAQVGKSFNCELTVTDTAGNSTTDSVQVNIIGLEISISSPAEKATDYGPTIYFVGKTTADFGNINVTYNDNILCTASISKSGTWNCQANMTPGNYTVTAVWTENKLQSSAPRTFTVLEPIPDNNPPVIVVDKTYSGTPGSVIDIDSSKSNDPDGDAITFKWVAPQDGLLSSTTSATPKFTIPSNAKVGSSYDLVLTVTDAKGASVNTDITINVESFNYIISIDSPAIDEVLPSGNTSITGQTTIPDGNHILVNNVKNGRPLCSAEVKDLTWSCSFPFKEGYYTIVAVWSEGVDVDPTNSQNVSFIIRDSVLPNNPPVIVIEDSFTAAPGESVILDASKSYDPDEDSISFAWTGLHTSLLSSTTDKMPIFTMPSTAVEGELYELTLTVTDSKGASDSKKITVSPTPIDSYIVDILKPANNDVVKNPVIVSGKASPNQTVEVRTSKSDELICKSTSSKTGEWDCQTTLPGGTYDIKAVLPDTKPLAESQIVTFDVEEDLARPIIVSPVENDITSVTPTISGTMSETSGNVLVWTVDGAISTMLCTANVQKDGSWSCIAGYELDYSTSYTIQAYWKDGDKTSAMSENVHITTEDMPLANITFISPTDGFEQSYGNPVIFAGNTDPGTVVNVYIQKEDDSEWTLECFDIANADGYWACENTWLLPGNYTAIADDGSDELVIPSLPVNFTLTPDLPISDSNQYEDVKGGSCSMTAVPASHYGWFFLFAGFAGLGLARRRKSE